MKPVLTACFLVMLLSLTLATALAEASDTDENKKAGESTRETPETQSFGGPSSVGGQVKADQTIQMAPYHFTGAEKEIEPWYEFKSRVSKDHGFSFGGDYNLSYQGASESLGEDNAAGGILRLYATWTLTGRGTPDTGALVAKVENRHRIATDIAPQQLASEIGYAGLTSIIYSDAGNLLTNLYWQQSFKNNRWAFIAGIVDTTDYVALYGMANPWTEVSNLVFSTDPTIPVPNQGLGGALLGRIKDNYYLLAGLADTNGDPGDTGDSFDSFFDDHEYFKHVEFGWFPTWENRYVENTHVTFWQADERKEAGVPEGWGASFSFSRMINKQWLSFLRAGYSDGGGGSMLERSLGAGVGYYRQTRKDFMGMGVNWGQPSEGTFGKLDDQVTFEWYYRFQIFRHMTFTPSVQLLVNPALNPEEDRIWVLGIRTRITL